MKNTIAIILFMMASASNSSIANRLQNELNGEAILQKVVEGFSDIRDFIVTIDAEVKMEQVQVPNMHATMYFKKPDKIHFDSEGFLFVPRDGIMLNPAVLSEQYNASLMQSEMSNGRIVYKLQLAAKEVKTRLRQMYVWVDSVNWTLLKIETIPYEGRTLSMDFTYGFIQEKYWLPLKIVFNLGSSLEKEKPQEESGPKQSPQFGQTQRSMPRSGSVTISYSDYKVNTGINDSIFQEKK